MKSTHVEWCRNVANLYVPIYIFGYIFYDYDSTYTYISIGCIYTITRAYTLTVVVVHSYMKHTV